MQSIVVLGNTPSAWLAAVFLRKRLNCDVTIVAPILQTSVSKVASVESISPDALEIHDVIGLNEKEWMYHSGGMFELAAQFVDASQDSASHKNTAPLFDFMLAHTKTGIDFDGLAFHHFFKLQNETSFDDFSLAAQMAKQNKFVLPVADQTSILSTLDYGISIDTNMYTRYLVGFAQHIGINVEEVAALNVIYDGCTQAKHQDHPQLDDHCVSIQSVVLDDGESLQADLFIDASDELAVFNHLSSLSDVTPESTNTKRGATRQRSARQVLTQQDSTLFDSVLIGATQVGHAAKCYKSIQTLKDGLLVTYRLAQQTYYQFYYNSQFTSERQASVVLKRHTQPASLENMLHESSHTQLTSWDEHDKWRANCVAVGQGIGNPALLFTGHIELTLRAMHRLVDLIAVDTKAVFNRQEYNRLSKEEVRRYDEFQVGMLKSLSLKLGNQPHSATATQPSFWTCVARRPLSQSLKHKLALFNKRGTLAAYETDPIRDNLWINLFMGLGLVPQSYLPLLDMQDNSDLDAKMQRLKSMITHTTQQLPDVNTFLRHLYKA